MLTNSPYGKLINDFLEDRVMAFKPEEMDQVYSAKFDNVNRLEQKLLSILPETMDAAIGPINIHEMLPNLIEMVNKFKENLQSALPGTGAPDSETGPVNINEVIAKLIEEITGFEQKLQITNTVIQPVNIHEILNEMIEGNSYLEGIATEYAYKKGFSEGVKFIFYSLVMG